MNENQLDELLARKKSVPVKFDKSEAQFAADFFAAIERPEKRTFPIWRYAAGFLLFCGLAAAIYAAFPGARDAEDVKYGKISEAVRLFGGDAAVLFWGDELLTGERESTEIPANLVNIELCSGGKRIDLSLACADNDSLYLDTARVSGNVVISRCDAATLVLDVDLQIDGRTVRTVLPVTRRQGNCYREGARS